MKTLLQLAAVILASSLILAGCQTPRYDYSNFYAHPPRSILVLPPINETNDLEATYGYYTTLSQPIAERGYYVFPLALVDQVMKENGLPTAGEMQGASLAKMGQVIGADAVLYTTLKQYGSKFRVIGSDTTVEVLARLVDTRTGVLLWEGHGIATESVALNGGNSLLLASIVAAAGHISSKKTDKAHTVSREANEDLFAKKGTGLPYGPYSPNYHTER
jgi:hypothetical protein